MSVLSVYHQNRPEQPLKVLTHHDDIAATLAEVEVRLERLDARAALAADASPEEVLAAYRPQIDRLQAERDYATADVLRVTGNDRQQDALRARFFEEHRHAEDEVRFVVAGRGLFNLRLGELVYAVLCEKGDLLTVPAGVRHWLDMGEHPHFVTIRLFRNSEGWSAEFTGDDIASRFPRLED
ncbi:oxidase [Stutzerimonas stutzeri TS44]|nr:oxidase [Stutzerimonas stutzeri TS44]